MKKLLYIANLRLPTEKAYGIQIAKMCEAFAAQTNMEEKMEVELVAPRRKNNIKEDFFDYYSVRKNLKFKRIWAPDFYLPGFLDKIAVFIKNTISALGLAFYAFRKKPDIIYSRDELPLYFLSFFKNNLIFEAHRFSKSRNSFYKRFINKNFKVVVITGKLKEDFIKIGFKPENILLAPDGVDLAEFDIDISKGDARIRVGLPSDKKIAMYAGHLFEWKGAGTLLHAAKLIFNSQFLVSENSKILFVFVGGTEHDIKEFRKKTERLNNILILGHKPHKDIPFFLKAADVLILPNSAKEELPRYYTSPLKLFEYMASGRPIIASDLPSIREILNQKNSLLVEPDNIGHLAEAVTKIINDPAKSDQHARKALEDVKSYTWKNRVIKILNFI